MSYFRDTAKYSEHGKLSKEEFDRMEEYEALQAVEAWNRSQKFDYKERAKSSPLLVAGFTMIGVIAMGRMFYYSIAKRRPGFNMENYILHTRMYAQGTGVAVLSCYAFYEIFRVKILGQEVNLDKEKIRQLKLADEKREREAKLKSIE